MSGRARPDRRPPRPELSQHFLRDAIAARLVRALPITRSDLVIEIGAGRGALTKPLSRCTRRLVAVEVDAYLAGKLRRMLDNRATVVTADFLRFSLPAEPYRVVGNIPYAGSHEIVAHLVDAHDPPADAWLIVQREFAHRLCGRPYGRESLRSLALKPLWHLEVLDRLKRTDFEPPPSVDSVVLHFGQRVRPLLDTTGRALLERLTREAFADGGSMQRAVRRHVSKPQLRRLAADLRFAVDADPGDLSFEQWLGILRFLQRTWA